YLGVLTKVELAFTHKARLRMALHMFLIAFIGLCIFFNGRAGQYHSVSYKTELTSCQGLDEFVRNFLSRRQAAGRSDQPIYLIAADGGGQKAAYWTTRLLNELEKDSTANFDFQHDVFAAAGASGGSVGLGLYTYMYADDAIRLETDPTKKQAEINARVQAMGEYNFLSADFGGLMARWPLKFIPLDAMADCKDRMDIIGRNYFGTMSDHHDPNEINMEQDPVFQRAYPYLWQKTDYALPLFITNTARVEDGSKGIMHPLDPEDVKQIFGGVMDLTYKTEAGKQTAISFGDALMTTNRFPIFSPMAKIDGRGHFVDAGAVDNSGKGTILQLLQYMHQRANDHDPLYQQLMAQKVVLVSVRCDKQRYYYETFKCYVDEMAQTDQEYYLPSYLSGAINTGLTGSPRAFEGLLDNQTHREAFGLDAKVINLSIPFYVESVEDVFGVLGSEVSDESLIYLEIDSVRNETNKALWAQLGREVIYRKSDTLEAARPPLLEPPLARILSHSSRDYMDAVARHKA
ncbi:MAG: hypothetical protein AAFQ87_26075, partial [Bacteroidota bacterium]